MVNFTGYCTRRSTDDIKPHPVLPGNDNKVYLLTS
jgi:hypothetical protein